MRRILFIIAMWLSVIANAQIGIITTVAGNGVGSYAGDGGPAINAGFHGPRHIAFDTSGNMYVADYYNICIRKIDQQGIVTTVAGNGLPGWSLNGYPATMACFHSPTGVTVDKHMNIYVSDDDHSIRKITPAGLIYYSAGGGGASGLLEGAPATSRVINYPKQVTVDDNNNIYISASSDNLARFIDTAGILHNLAGHLDISGTYPLPLAGFSGDGGPATAALLRSPVAICIDKRGNKYIADADNVRIRKVDTFGVITTFAGNGLYGNSGDGGPATNAKLYNPTGLVADDSGNVYIADVGNHSVRRVSPSGIISTVVGSGIAGAGGDGGLAKCAELDAPVGLAIDKAGNLYISDQNSNKIRKVSFNADYVSDSMSVTINRLCSGPAMTILKRTYSSSLSVKTWFGDNTSVTTVMGSCGTIAVANISHTYQLPGTYSIKHVLYDGAAKVDSMVYAYEYLMCNNYTVKFYNDYNNNCSKDGTEPYSQFPVVVEVDSNSTPIDTISGLGGIYYSAYGSTGDIYTFKIINAPAGQYISCPAAGVIADTLQAGMYNNPVKYFALGCLTGADYDVAEFSALRAGRHMSTGSILVQNTFCNPESAVVTLHFSPEYIFSSAYPAPSSVVGHTATWNIGNIASNLAAAPVINYTLTTPTPFDAATWLTPGDTVQSMMIANPHTGDVDTGSNVIIRVDTVKSSYDPNEVSVLPEGYILPGTRLRYTINFENTGNDTAHNIYVMDTLSADVDLATLRPLASSATMNMVTMVSGGYKIVKFDFPGINLLDSSHHNQCDGMVVFTINATAAIPEGTLVQNHAGIFFDDNPVVMTNMVTNTVFIPAVTITTTSPTTICYTQAVHFTATPHSALPPHFRWYINGVVAGSDSLSFTANALVTGDLINCDLYDITGDTTIAASNNIVITVDTPLTAVVTGTPALCVGGVATLSVSVPGGMWSQSNANVSLLGGVMSGISAGSVIISYAVANACGADTATYSAVVNPLPLAGTISGLSTVCASATISLTCAVIGGIWSSSSINASVAAGLVTGVTAGNAIISYSVTNGCGTAVDTFAININPLPVAGTIVGTTVLCAGELVTLTNSVPAGIWSSSSSSVASVSGGGIVTGASAGAAIISYTVTNSCGTAMDTMAITVNSLPVAGTIAGTPSVCAGAVETLTNATSGGTWSSSNANATVAGGLVTGVSTGSSIISYSVTNSCGTAIDTMAVTINPLPVAGGLSGVAVFCMGTSITLTPTITGGVWTASNANVYVIGGTVTGVNAGASLISYTVANSCGLAYAVYPVTVESFPVAGTIFGLGSVCIGETITLTAAGSGAWDVVNNNASVTGGIVTGLAYGVDTVLYIVNNTCGADSSKAVVFVTPCNTGIPGQLTGNIVIYPNPSDGNFSVAVPESANEVAITVTDISGRVILLCQISNKSAAIPLSLGRISPGTYLINVDVDGKIYRDKIEVW